MSGTPVSIFQILGMRFRGNRPDVIIPAYTTLVFRGEDVSIGDVESTYIANRGTIRNAQDLIQLMTAEETPPRP